MRLCGLAGMERQLRVRHILVRPDQEDLLRDIEAQLKGVLPLMHGHCPFTAERLFPRLIVVGLKYDAAPFGHSGRRAHYLAFWNLRLFARQRISARGAEVCLKRPT